MMKFFKKNKLGFFQKGSTLIELIIAVMIVGLIVTAVANAITHSIKNTGEARYKQVATTLGQEVVEHFRSQKNELGMVNLYNSLADTAYCYSNISAPASGVCGVSDFVPLADTEFRRDVGIAKGGNGQRSDPYTVTVTVVVSWIDGSTTRNVELVQELKQSSGFVN